MEQSLLSLLQKEQEIVQDLNEHIQNYDYHATKPEVDPRRDQILEWYQVRIDIANKNLPRVREKIAEKLNTYLTR